jgi:hypothetical protein
MTSPSLESETAGPSFMSELGLVGDDSSEQQNETTRPHSRMLRGSYQHLMVTSPEERAKAERQRILAQTQRIPEGGVTTTEEVMRHGRLVRSGASSAALMKASVKRLMSARGSITRMSSIATATKSVQRNNKSACGATEGISEVARPSSRIRRAWLYPAFFK